MTDNYERSPEKTSSLSRDVIALVISLIVLAISLVIVWFSKEFLKVPDESETLLLSLILIPFIAFMFFSGRIKNIPTPWGDMQTKFKEVTQEPVSRLSSLTETIERADELTVVRTIGVKELVAELRGSFDRSKPVALILPAGKGYRYDRQALFDYNESLSQFSNYKLVIILDMYRRVLGFTTNWRFRNIVAGDEQYPENEFVNKLNDPDLSMDQLRNYMGEHPLIETTSISINETNIDALRMMDRKNLEALVVTGEDRVLMGMIGRDQIFTRIFLAMAK
ncbi:MAG: hypothetical protein ACFFD4_21215 [Candidatus Odinarchaeota archaeon]